MALVLHISDINLIQSEGKMKKAVVVSVLLFVVLGCSKFKENSKVKETDSSGNLYDSSGNVRDNSQYFYISNLKIGDDEIKVINTLGKPKKTTEDNDKEKRLHKWLTYDGLEVMLIDNGIVRIECSKSTYSAYGGLKVGNTYEDFEKKIPKTEINQSHIDEEGQNNVFISMHGPEIMLHFAFKHNLITNISLYCSDEDGAE